MRARSGVCVCAVVFVVVTLLPLGFAGVWQVDTPIDGVWVLRNDAGGWGGWSMGVSHMVNPEYQVRKTLDLTALPAALREQAISARIRVYFGIQDYSWNQGERRHNGLDEHFEIRVNGQSTTVATADPRCAAKAGPGDTLAMAWTDFPIPLESLREDRLEVFLRKLPAAGKTAPDDYIYPGIDGSVDNNASEASFDGGETWHSDRLNTIGAQGEFMIRLLLATRSLDGSLQWTPGGGLEDPEGVAGYAAVEEDGVLRIEPRDGAWDATREVTLRVTHSGPAPAVSWRLAGGGTAPISRGGGDPLTVTLGPSRQAIEALLLQPQEGTTLEHVRLDFGLPTVLRPPQVNLCPPVSAARGRRRSREPVCRLSAAGAVLENASLRAEFAFAPVFRLTSLEAVDVARNVLAQPEATHLFRVKVGETIYGCRDARVARITPIAQGFTAELELLPVGLRLLLQVSVDERELGLGLTLRNTGVEPTEFYLGFPHLAGLQLSDDAADDYYLFPWGGGIIGNANAALRTAYGENSAWWQMIDLFSPGRGGGLYVRADDPTGLYKAMHLRKGHTVPAGYQLDETGGGFMDPAMQWRNALEALPGTGICFEYLRRHRDPGGEFSAPSVRLGAHAGDWRQAMRTYAEWSKKTWPPRPFPSKVTSCWTVLAVGWGWEGALFKDGAYRDDYIDPRWDIPELMSWWSWSEIGPWNTPLERIEEDLGTAFYNRYKAYWVTDPLNGEPRYNLNRGDYDGYNPRWGGLPALRAHIEKMKAAGQVPMFYTDPILACATTRLGAQYGATYGVMNPRWQGGVYQTPKTPEGYVGAYASYCMCLDTEWYSAWVADTMERVCRETGIAGIRLDEYGHRGYVCHSPHHEHLFAEPGHNAWLQALARNCRQVHEAMDRVQPDLVLTTEFPGNDHMAAALEGAIVYDLRRVNTVRPTPINLFRFFFPECRTMEIDRPAAMHAEDWMLWNATATFGRGAAYSDAVLAVLRSHGDAFNGRDIEPLVPTLVPRVYANRFRAPGKTIWTVLNATGHTVDAPLLRVGVAAPRSRVLDLLSGRELIPDQDGAVSLRLRQNQCAVIARLSGRSAPSQE